MLIGVALFVLRSSYLIAEATVFTNAPVFSNISPLIYHEACVRFDAPPRHYVSSDGVPYIVCDETNALKNVNSSCHIEYSDNRLVVPNEFCAILGGFCVRLRENVGVCAPAIPVDGNLWPEALPTGMNCRQKCDEDRAIFIYWDGYGIEETICACSKSSKRTDAQLESIFDTLAREQSLNCDIYQWDERIVDSMTHTTSTADPNDVVSFCICSCSSTKGSDAQRESIFDTLAREQNCDSYDRWDDRVVESSSTAHLYAAVSFSPSAHALSCPIRFGPFLITTRDSNDCWDETDILSLCPSHLPGSLYPSRSEICNLEFQLTRRPFIFVVTSSSSRLSRSVIDYWNVKVAQGGIYTYGGYLRIPLPGFYAIWGQVNGCQKGSPCRVVRRSNDVKTTAAFVQTEEQRGTVIIADLVWCDRDDTLSFVFDKSFDDLPRVSLTVGLVAQKR